MKKFLLAIFLLVSVSVHAYQPAVVSANPAATHVGIEVLKKGGSAADAAIASAFALSIVEPYNSGLGGGGMLLYYSAHDKEFYFLDYREVAPASISEIKNQNFIEPATAVAVPGFVKGMEAFYKKFSKLSWSELISPSIALAEKGLATKGLVANRIKENKDLLEKDDYLKSIYLAPLENQENRINLTDLSYTLKAIETGGSHIFYQGSMATAIESTIKAQGGILTAEDLANYQVFWRKPVSFKYKNYKIVSAPLPSTGGRALDMLYRKSQVSRLQDAFPYSPESAELMMKAFKDYFEFRNSALGDTTSNLVAHTTHLNVIDKEGNMVAMTNTLNHSFGAGIGVPGTGIILNDEMRDFSQKPNSPNFPKAGRRPLSSMTPTFVYKDGAPYLIIGTPGGLTIPQNIFQILYSVMEWNNSVDFAINRPKIYYDPIKEKVVVEKGTSVRIRNFFEQQAPIDQLDKIGNVQALVIKSPMRTIPFSDLRGEGMGEVLGR